MKKTIKEMIEVMQAFEDGKQIQAYDARSDTWIDIADPTWGWCLNDYRIKPNLAYRPYESTDELIADYKERFNVDNPPYTIPLIWVKEVGFSKDRGTLITSFDEDKAWLGAHYVATTLQEFFKEYAYLDGTPVGKLVEE